MNDGTGVEGRDLDQSLLDLGALELGQELDGELAPVAPEASLDVALEALLDTINGRITEGLDVEVGTNDKGLDGVFDVVLLQSGGVEISQHGLNVVGGESLVD